MLLINLLEVLDSLNKVTLTTLTVGFFFGVSLFCFI